MQCPSCNVNVPEGSKFCGKCGNLLPRPCPTCGHAVPADNQFCSECGTSIAPEKGAATGPAARRTASTGSTGSAAERRQLTIMFCDLVGSTARSTQLDPEDLREVIAAYHKCVADVVASYQGFVAQYLGDGALVYFGYPQAREDDVERAVRAALAAVDAVPRLTTKHGERLEVRVGIATGPVVVGEIVGVSKEKGAIGETPNLAARLQAVSEPNAVVIATSTRDLTGGLFEYRDLGRYDLKGFAEPVRAWQVLHTSAVASRFEALRSGYMRIVGRDEELELLSRRWQQIKTGEGRVVLLSGEAGIGKSRITSALEENLQGDAHIRLRYFCSPQHQDSALYPVISQIVHAAEFERDDSSERKLNKLEALLAQSTKEPEEVGLIADLLSIPASDRLPRVNLSPQKRRQRTLETLALQLVGLAARQPVLMIFEDLHWIDPTSLEMLDRTIDQVQHLPVLLVMTFRPEFTPPWADRPYVTMHPLSRLSRRQGTAMIEQIAGAGAPLPKEVAEQILDRTDGVPLFVEELTKAVLEIGPRTGDPTFAGATSAIPRTLHASLMARLDRLSPVREVAQIGAAIGREFSYQLLAAVYRQSEDRLQDALRELSASELVFRRGTPPTAIYRFKHALVQDAAYSTLLRDQRKELHARIGQAFEHWSPETAELQPEILAHHFTEAGLSESAIAYWFKAGKRDLSRSSYVEGVKHLLQGIELIQHMRSSAERNRKELDFYIALGPAIIAVKGLGSLETVRVYSRARELLGDSGAVTEQLTVYAGLWASHHGRVEHLQARDVAQACLAFATRRGDNGALALANKLLGQTSYVMGAFVDARQQLQQTISFSSDKTNTTSGVSHGPDDAATALSFLSRTLWPLGYPEQAVAASAQALTLARVAGPMTTAVVMFGEVLLGTMGDDLQRTSLRASEFLDNCIEHTIGSFEIRARFYQGALLAQSDPQRGIEIMRTTMESLKSTVYRPVELGILAAAYGRLGQVQVGLGLLGDAIEITDKTNEKSFEAELHRLRSELLVVLGNRDEAKASLLKALTIARKQEARLWELRAAAALVRIWRHEGRHAEARDLLSPVYAWFTEGLELPDLKDAKGLLDQLRG